MREREGEKDREGERVGGREGRREKGNRPGPTRGFRPLYFKWEYSSASPTLISHCTRPYIVAQLP